MYPSASTITTLELKTCTQIFIWRMGDLNLDTNAYVASTLPIDPFPSYKIFLDTYDNTDMKLP